jgi:hypothetical protein
MSNHILTTPYVVDNIIDFYIDYTYPKKYSSLRRINKAFNREAKNRNYDKMYNILSYYMYYITSYPRIDFYINIILTNLKFQQNLINYTLQKNNYSDVAKLIKNFSSNKDFKFGASYLLTELIIQDKINSYVKVYNESSNELCVFDTCSDNIIHYYKTYDKLPHNDTIIMTFAFCHFIKNITREFQENDNNYKSTNHEKQCINLYMQFFGFLRNISTQMYLNIMNNLWSNKFLGFQVPTCIYEYHKCLLHEDHLYKYNKLSVYLYLSTLLLFIFETKHTPCTWSFYKDHIITKINKLFDNYPYLFEKFQEDYAIFSMYEKLDVGKYIYNFLSRILKKEYKFWHILNIIIGQHFPFISNIEQLDNEFYSSFAYLYKHDS